MGRTGKNLLPMTVAGIKATNTSGTWVDNAYTYNGVTFTILLDESGNVTGINVNGTATANTDLYIVAGFGAGLPACVLSGCPTGGGSTTYRLIWDSNAADSGTSETVATPTSGNVRIRVTNGVSVTNKVFYPMIRDASVSDATFEPYKGHTLTIALGQTVYGGTLDVLTGVLTIDRALVTLNGSEDNWLYSASYGGYAYNSSTAAIMPNFKASTTVISDKLKSGTVSELADSSKTDLVCLTTVMCVKLDSSYDTVDKYKTWLSNNNLQVCYELATPTTVQLTPAQLMMLKGYNSLSTDGGDVITVTAYAINEEVGA